MTQRQEQQPASEEVSEVAPGTLRMELDIRMPGLGHVNCYALVDSEGAALVDPGLPGGHSWKTLCARLARADLAVKDVHTVIITHSHPDHFGGAVRLAKEAGAKVVAYHNFNAGFGGGSHHDAPEVSVDDLAAQAEAAEAAEDPSEEPQKAAVGAYDPSEASGPGGPTPWGGERSRPPWKMLLKWRAMRLLGRGSWYPTITDGVAQGDVLRLAGREWFVVHTPGHTEDHFCLHDPESGTFLAGDHVLPTITPHISGLSLRPDPLDAFFESLDRVAAIPDVERVLPAHGHPFDDLASRAEAIKRHHHERLDKIRAIGRELGPASVNRIMQQLFKQRSWGGMAESETYAHLEHLRIAKDAECHEDAGGQLVYSLG
jgi:glyoxylase-like metal-dependent hydrolase (beta-lactamase superfamily II)